MTEVSVWLAQVQPSNPYQSIVKLYFPIVKYIVNLLNCLLNCLLKLNCVDFDVWLELIWSLNGNRKSDQVNFLNFFYSLCMIIECCSIELIVKSYYITYTNFIALPLYRKCFASILLPRCSHPMYQSPLDLLSTE